MLNISSIAKAEKNKLHTDSAFIVLARIVPPASTGVSEICIAHNNEDIVWQGKLWQAFPFGIGDSKADNTGSEPSIEFKVSNVSRTLTYLLEQAGGGTGSKIYIYVVNTAEIKGENQHSAGLADPTFTRASTAYDDSGSVVAANTPRMSGRGLLIEEGTTNLLNSTSQNGSINASSGTTFPTFITTGLVQGGTYTLHGYKKIYSDDTATNTRPSISFNYSDGTAIAYFSTFNIAKDGEWHEVLVTCTADSTKTLTRIDFCITDYSNGGTGDTKLWHQEFKQYSAEQKPYATSYTDGTRAADQFKIPVEAINPTAWTIEFDAQVNLIYNYNVFFDTLQNAGGPKFETWLYSTGTLAFAYYKNVSEQARVTTNITIKDYNKHHYKFSYDGDTVKVYLDGVLKSTQSGVTIYSGTTTGQYYFSIGRSFDNYYLDGYISNLRISNVCRPDNDTTPAVDSHTTYYMPLTDNMNFTAQAELEEQYTVGKTSVDENWVTFTLGAGYSLRTRRPFYRYMKNSCPFKYKGTRCACTSSEATCRHTLADCRARGNSKRYGGFPGIDQKGLYLE